MTRPFSILFITVGIGAVAATPSHASAQEADVQRLNLEQYLDMESVSNPQISPDASQIVYTRGWVDRVNDQRRRNQLHSMRGHERDSSAEEMREKPPAEMAGCREQCVRKLQKI